MAFEYYRSDDASAPTLSGTAGDLINVLDAILVNGYGSKPAAGWTKAFSGTNLAAYRMSTASGSNGHYIRVDDTGAQEARWRGFVTMSDVNTGTDPFPTDAQISGGLFARKSNLASTAVRAWLCFADERRFYFFAFTTSTTHGTSDSNTASIMFGQGVADSPSDTFFTFAIGRAVTGAPVDRAATSFTGSFSACVGHYVPRIAAGTGTSFNFGRAQNSWNAASTLGAASGSTVYPTTGGNLHMVPLIAAETSNLYRGTFPGVFAPAHVSTALTHLDTFSGKAGTLLDGKTFVILRAFNASTQGTLIFQTNGSIE